MENIIKYKGKILFDPIDKTSKHEKQASWKKVAMILLDGDICEYYSWFLEKRYGIKINIPLRGPHISFINDSIYDIIKNSGLNEKEVNILWDNVKNKWNGKEIELLLNLDARSSSEYWWLNIVEYEQLNIIRKELGLSDPFYKFHMSIGNIRTGIHEEQYKYTYKLIKNGFIY